MIGNRGAQQYKQLSITTASRGQVLIMLYEGAIRHIKRAMIAIDKQDRASKGVYIGKAHDIVMELINSLDHKIGGAVSQDLERLYNFMIEQLIKGNFENSKAPLELVIKNLETLLSAWKVAVAQVEKGQAAS